MTSATEARDLARDTAVTRLRVAPGWYTAEISDGWNFRTPSGGVLMTIAMRAMHEELADPNLRPVSANTHFCSPVPAGPLEIRVEVLRHGNAAAQIRAQLSSTAMPGPGLEVSATFGRNRSGLDLIDTEPPEVPVPEKCRDMADIRGLDMQVPPFFANLDSRLAFGNAWWTPDWKPGPARIARWFRYKIPQRLTNGCFDPLAIPPLADTMVPALVQKLGPGQRRFIAPSLDLTVHFLDPSESQWILTNCRARRARDGYATADAEIWDDAGHLLAFATQTMMLRSVPPGMKIP